jgi:uncharacterized RDD family membrane protein YckC
MSPEEPTSPSPRPAEGDSAGLGLAGRVVGSLADLGLRAGGRVVNRLGLGDVARTAMDRALAGPIAERMTQQLVEQGVIERVTYELIAGGVPTRVVDQVMASELPEQVIDRIMTREFSERVVARVLESPGIEPAAVEVIESELVDELTRRVLDSEELQMTIERVAQSPEVRNALAYQGVGFLTDIGRQISSFAQRLDGPVEAIPRRLFRRPRRTHRPREAGAASRLLAAAVDALIVNTFLLALTGAISLIISALGGDGAKLTGGEALAAGGTVWLATAGAYLAFFWTLAGQTPGMRFARLQLMKVDGSSLSGRDSVRRLFGMVIAAIPFFLGFLAILVNEQRRGWQDRIGRTVVRYEPEERLALPPGSGRERLLPGYHGSSQREPTKG